MRTVLQRVASAEVCVSGQSVGKTGPGLLLFLGVEKHDTTVDLEWLVDKIPRIRCFEDEDGRMNRDLRDSGGEILVISQFTLYGSLRKGTRPSFNKAADPEMAKAMYLQFVEKLRESIETTVQTGIFAAEMKITALNDGPVTLILDTKNRDF